VYLGHLVHQVHRVLLGHLVRLVRSGHLGVPLECACADVCAHVRQDRLGRLCMYMIVSRQLFKQRTWSSGSAGATWSAWNARWQLTCWHVFESGHSCKKRTTL
jgi:hypothetical protein